MEITEKSEERGLLLVLAGKLDGNSSPPTQERLLNVIERGERKVLLDLAGVDYVNSAGLRVFMMAAKKIKSVGGKLAICGMTPNVHELFDIAGFLPLIPTYPSRDEGFVALQ
jgi:anti-sigma B factor antagonist